ncbi:hypothetical protein F5B18DRAFT_617915 [Nemania serpens]|nr:hypothetical protein F5B18DRAFT_617915 [Nemania serpens]
MSIRIPYRPLAILPCTIFPFGLGFHFPFDDARAYLRCHPLDGAGNRKRQIDRKALRRNIGRRFIVHDFNLFIFFSFSPLPFVCGTLELDRSLWKFLLARMDG